MSSLIDLTEKEEQLAGRLDKDVASALAVSDSAGGVSFSNASQVMEFAKLMAIANLGVRKHLRGNPGACLAICVQAIEWGMSTFAVANKSYSVNDQLAFESQLIQAVILKRAPIKGRFKVEFKGEGDKRVCRIWAELKEPAGETVEYTSPEFGKIQPKNSPLWKSDPDQQHFYYSGRALCRRHFPDILLGVYAEDEVLPHIGPDNAVDVTPRGLAGKLDALAKSGAGARGADDDMPGFGVDTVQVEDAPQEAAPEAQEALQEVGEQDLDPIAIARRLGAVARREGLERRAIPGVYRDAQRVPELNAWRHGWDNFQDVLEDAQP
jgi:hypothetical protein